MIYTSLLSINPLDKAKVAKPRVVMKVKGLQQGQRLDLALYALSV